MDDDPTGTGVRATYERIADHFSATREYPWPEIESFLDERETGGVGLDLGCGNGRHVPPLGTVTDRVLAADVSHGLLDAARERLRDEPTPVDFLQADAATVPVRSDVIAVAIYVATLHHLPSRDARVGSLDELARILAPGGRALVSAWSTEHDRFDASVGFDTTVDWTLPDGETVPRYYHIYDPDEFRTAIAESALEAVEAFVSSGNCYAVVRPAEQ